MNSSLCHFLIIRIFFLGFCFLTFPTIFPSFFLIKVDHLNPLMHNVPKWPDTLLKSCSKYCKIFKVCLTILGQYAFKG